MASEGEIDTKLIHLVEQFPGLYDKSSTDYKNPIAVAAMWDIISKKLKTSSTLNELPAYCVSVTFG